MTLTYSLLPEKLTNAWFTLRDTSGRNTNLSVLGVDHVMSDHVSRT